MKRTNYLFAILFVIFVTFVVGCGAENNEKAEATPAVKEDENVILKVGVMPAVDSAPIFLAEEKGYFEELGLDAEIQVYTNAMNRQSALQSGELDGAMTDVIALVNNVENGFDIKVTTSTDGSFPFLINYEGKGTLTNIYVRVPLLFKGKILIINSH